MSRKTDEENREYLRRAEVALGREYGANEKREEFLERAGCDKQGRRV